MSRYPNITDSIYINVLKCNPSVQHTTIHHLKSDDRMGVGIERLIYSIERVFTGGAPAPEEFGDTTFSAYWNNCGTTLLGGGFFDENNLSLVVFVKCGQHKFIFPGDMERAGWLQLLQNPAFVAELRGVNVFVASHHGREDGCCEEVMKVCAGVDAVVISDKSKGYQSQDTVDWY